MFHPAILVLAILGCSFIGAMTGIYVNELGKRMGICLGMDRESYIRFYRYVYRPFDETQWIPNWVMIGLSTPALVTLTFVSITTLLGLTKGIALSFWIMLGIFYMGMYSQQTITKPFVSYLSIALGYILIISFLVYEYNNTKTDVYKVLKVVLAIILIRETNQGGHTYQPRQETPSFLEHLYWEPLFMADLLRKLIVA